MSSSSASPPVLPAPPPLTVSAALAAVGSGGRSRPVLSVELLPPRPAARAGFGAAVEHLAGAGLDFASVTYGAAGSGRGASVATVAEVATHLPVLAHLTCVAHSPWELTHIAGQFLDAGAQGFLALRGDPPAEPGWVPPARALGSSAELVRLLHDVAEQRGHGLDVAVAAFPGGHPGSTDRTQDLAALHAKADAGAAFAITQVVFDAGEYAALADDARAAGLALPLVPGVLPLTDPERVVRVARLAGVEPPADLLAQLSAVDGDTRTSLGVELTARLARDLLDAGAPGLHLYSMNRHEAVVDVLDALDLLPTDRPCSCPGGRS